MNQKTDAYRRIVAAAAMAPSAENTQPWQFVADADSLTVYLDTTRTLASDIGHTLSLTAIGACIENAVIAATAEQWRAEVEYHSETLSTHLQSRRLPIALIRFREGAQRDPLADCIRSRSTRRRMDP